jgi:cytohesin
MTLAELFEMLLTEPEETIRQAIHEDPTVLDIRTDKGLSPMAWAWWNGRPEVAEMLIDAGADLDFYDTVYMGSAAQLEELLPRSFHLANSFSPLGLPPLMLAGPDPVKVRMLLEAGANVNVRGRTRAGETPLTNAAVMEAPRETMELLLVAGADPNAANRQGYTALSAAAAWGDRELVDLLLSYGARPGLRVKDGRSPADFADEDGHVDLAHFLRAAAGPDTEEIIQEEVLEPYEEPFTLKLSKPRRMWATFP